MQNFQAPFFVRHAKLDFAIEPAKTTQGSIYGVGAVRCADDDDLAAALHTVHQGQEHRHNSPLQFTVGFFTIWGNGIDFVNENDRRGVLLCFFKGSPQVGFRVPSHLGHNFGTVDQEEKGTGLVRDSPCDHSLTRPRRTMQKYPFWRFDSECSEQVGMAEGQLDHLTNGSQLLANTSEVVVAKLVQTFLIIPLDRVTITVNDCFGGNDAEFFVCGVDFHDLELDRAEPFSNQEGVAFADWPVSLCKIRFQVSLKEVPGNALDAVVEREDVNGFAVSNFTSVVD
mmetsp:Transcript_24461/g.34535  ORF Transcript_24461/g.34535 Transcript_24461/m.34535 type:complete len:283 (+) Transcript_24461:1497-2345(+)